MNPLYLIVMAGGSGTRFWPKSTSKRPKQLLSFGKSAGPKGGLSLLSETLSRFDGLVRTGQRLIVTTQGLRDAVTRDAPGVIVLAEPQGRNTAPCVYWAARAVHQMNPKGLMLVMPSDHVLSRPEEFRLSVERAIQRAEEHDELVTLGLKPDRPETGFGYLRTGASLGGACLKVDAFVEKPNLEKAREFVAAGNYLWNGGMFAWRTEIILEAFDRFMPEMGRAWDAAGGRVEDAYPRMTATSIDFGVMEKAPNVVTFPLACGWDDLGSWTALESVADSLGARHPAGVVTGGDAIAIDSSGNIVDAPGRLVALLGVNDLIVVESGDAILVARKDRAQDIRQVVEAVKRARPELA